MDHKDREQLKSLTKYHYDDRERENNERFSQFCTGEDGQGECHRFIGQGGTVRWMDWLFIDGDGALRVFQSVEPNSEVSRVIHLGRLIKSDEISRSW